MKLNFLDYGNGNKPIKQQFGNLFTQQYVWLSIFSSVEYWKRGFWTIAQITGFFFHWIFEGWNNEFDRTKIEHVYTTEG